MEKCMPPRLMRSDLRGQCWRKRSSSAALARTGRLAGQEHLWRPVWSELLASLWAAPMMTARPAGPLGGRDPWGLLTLCSQWAAQSGTLDRRFGWQQLDAVRWQAHLHVVTWLVRRLPERCRIRALLR